MKNVLLGLILLVLVIPSFTKTSKSSGVSVTPRDKGQTENITSNGEHFYFFREFPFTDSRMKQNQKQYEQDILETIIREFNGTANLTKKIDDFR